MYLFIIGIAAIIAMNAIMIVPMIIIVFMSPFLMLYFFICSSVSSSNVIFCVVVFVSPVSVLYVSFAGIVMLFLFCSA